MLRKGCFPRVERGVWVRERKRTSGLHWIEISLLFLFFTFSFLFFFGFQFKKKIVHDRYLTKLVCFGYPSLLVKREFAVELCFNYAAKNWIERGGGSFFTFVGNSGVLQSVSRYWFSFTDSISCRLILLETYYSKILFWIFLLLRLAWKILGSGF